MDPIADNSDLVGPSKDAAFAEAEGDGEESVGWLCGRSGFVGGEKGDGAWLTSRPAGCGCWSCECVRAGVDCWSED